MNGFSIGALVGLVATGALVLAGYVLKKKELAAQAAAADAEIKRRLAEAETKEQEVLARAKDKAIKILEEARLEEKRGLEALQKERNELLAHEKTLLTKTEAAEAERKTAEAERAKAAATLTQAEALRAQESAKLEEVARLTRDEALARLTAAVELEKQDVLLNRLRKLDLQETEEIERKAKNILAVAMQRLAASVVSETTVSYVELPNDEMKGRIIGREGRNIKALEYLTGCELIVDDTPGMITISGFSPIRRQVAKRALERLVADGRIQPAKVEEAIEEAKKELQIDIKKAGEDALYKLGISMAGIDPKLVQILGRLKYRSSYGQNALVHSIEVATFAGIIAEELKADVVVCKKGGLFHDIGKAVDHDMQGSHPELGYQIMKKFGFPEELCYQSIGHHEDKPKTLEAVIVKAADALSGARPGARRDSFDFYVKRLQDLENVALGFAGVDKAYAIQAGREIRVFVNPRAVNDGAAYRLAQDIAKRIEGELKYPGEIRVTLIRETRIIEYAR